MLEYRWGRGSKLHVLSRWPFGILYSMPIWQQWAYIRSSWDRSEPSSIYITPVQWLLVFITETYCTESYRLDSCTYVLPFWKSLENVRKHHFNITWLAAIIPILMNNADFDCDYCIQMSFALSYSYFLYKTRKNNVFVRWNALLCIACSSSKSLLGWNIISCAVMSWV